MFELTNAERRCFGLSPVLPSWKRVEVKPSPYDTHKTYAYLDGERVVKVLYLCEDEKNAKYTEYAVDEMLSPDGTRLLPKTAKGKSQLFTAATLSKRTPIGMAIGCGGGSVYLTNHTAQQDFYRSFYAGVSPTTLADFRAWVDDWCQATGEKEQADIDAFARKTRV